MSEVGAPPRPDTTCPTCEAGSERGQLVCLECGSRIALSYRRPPSWKVPVAISAVLLLVAGGVAVLAYQAIDDEAEREVAATPPRVAGAPSDGDGEGDTPARADIELGADAESGGAPDSDEEAPTEAASGSLVKDGALYTWPRNLEAFTVVLLSSEDRDSAATFARSAAETREEKIGVIRSDDFATLPQGFFVVFAGRYPDRAAADDAATGLGEQFPGAFAQVVRR